MKSRKTAICEGCGTEFIQTRKDRRYCSHACANKYNAVGKREPKEIPVCPHNEAVICDRHKCGSCGWNPTVSEKRLDAVIALSRMSDLEHTAIERMDWDEFLEVEDS